MHFKATEVLSSDFCRGLASDDENDQASTKDAFEILHFIARKRLAAGKLTVIDATNVQPEARKPLVELAREFHCLPVAIVLNIKESICHERNTARPNRNFGPHVIRQQSSQLKRSLKSLKREGFRHVFELNTIEEIAEVEIERQPLWNNKRDEHGPFDIIGDIHGCYTELQTLLGELGYEVTDDIARHPEGRKLVFLGDVVDRGPRITETLRLVMGSVREGTAHCVPGNHDIKLMRKLAGRDVQITHGLENSISQLESESDEFREDVRQFIDKLVSHYVFDDGKLVVAHAGMREEMQGRGSSKVRNFAYFGETTGEIDEFGLPVRYNWASEYRGKATVVYGHTPVPDVDWLNRTINIDTGCVFGGKLTTLRYPENEIVSVPATQIYAEPARPFQPNEEAEQALSLQQENDDVLDIDDVIGKLIISTRLNRTVTIREENSTAALEVMSRFAVNPRWLIYLPPTMSPCETSKKPGLLEHPDEAFAYYRHEGVSQVVCEQKHMGSRAVVIVCRDEDTARKRFGVIDEGIGICYTRTGRRFFNEPELESQMLGMVHEALSVSGFWEEFSTDWVCLDCELMPWSAKAQELLKQQYSAVGAASSAALNATVEVLESACNNGADVGCLLEKFRRRQEMAEQYVDAYRQYCWPVSSISDYKLAPFHILATDSGVHIDKDHVWHMETIAKICRSLDGGESLLLATPYKVIDMTDMANQDEGTRWWDDLTGSGGEGMVVKPMDFVMSGRKGLSQPAVKCRGKEYLRIIYGPEYDAPENLERLRSRALAAKRSLAVREFSLGVEGLERFIRKEPLRRVHECAFGVLALESEPVDPRL